MEFVFCKILCVFNEKQKIEKKLWTRKNFVYIIRHIINLKVLSAIKAESEKLFILYIYKYFRFISFSKTWKVNCNLLSDFDK